MDLAVLIARKFLGRSAEGDTSTPNTTEPDHAQGATPTNDNQQKGFESYVTGLFAAPKPFTKISKDGTKVRPDLSAKNEINELTDKVESLKVSENGKS